MQKAFFNNLISMLVLIVCFQALPVAANHCTYGTCEPQDDLTQYDVNPRCRVEHSGHLTTECNYNLEFYLCDGPRCVDGTATVVSNPCMLYGWCAPVVAINKCDSSEYVTTSYEKAHMITSWECPMNDCFWGDCRMFFPECSLGIASCPNS